MRVFCARKGKSAPRQDSDTAHGVVSAKFAVTYGRLVKGHRGSARITFKNTFTSSRHERKIAAAPVTVPPSSRAMHGTQRPWTPHRCGGVASHLDDLCCSARSLPELCRNFA